MFSNMIPIRCISCGKPVLADGENSKDILDDMGITRYCCRRMLISHVDLD